MESMPDITKQQLKLLKYLYRKPRTVAWIKKKFKVPGLRNICCGMFTLVYTSDEQFLDDCVVSISKDGIIEVESYQWLDGQFILTQILLPIVIAIITTLLTLFLSALL